MQIKAGETGVVRLFALGASDGGDAPALPMDAEQLGDALGVFALDSAHVDLIDIADLGEIGLTGYLRDGMGIAQGEIDAARAQLTGLRGCVAIVRSAAFCGAEVTLNARAPLRWVATFGEVPMDLTATPLTSAAATGRVHARAPAAPVSHTKTLLWVLAALAFFVIATISMLIRITA